MLVENQPVDRHVDVFFRVLRIERPEQLAFLELIIIALNLIAIKHDPHIIDS